MKRAIVVGTGAGGATAARELQGAFQVTVLEAGSEFRPFGADLGRLARWRRTGLFRDERLIQLLFPSMKVRPTPDDTLLVRGIGLGGTTTLATGNALRLDADLRALGINLDQEFEELGRELPISTEHRKRWTPSTRRLFDVCAEMGLDPQPTPKMVDYDRCRRCGRCVLGCPEGAKWDARRFLHDALGRGARLVADCRVLRAVTSGGAVTGVEARQGWRRAFFPADLVVLAAGGLGTPAILRSSGIAVEPRLFVDPVLCVAAEWKGSFQDREIPMPFVVQRPWFIVSPYFDYLSFFFNRNWRLPAHNIVSLMVKLADEPAGDPGKKGVNKVLTPLDRRRLGEGAELCTEILARVGVGKDEVFLGTVNAGHPGGTLPLSEREAGSLHHGRLPENLYVADASLFPRSLGNPPILTIMALSKAVARRCVRALAG